MDIKTAITDLQAMEAKLTEIGDFLTDKDDENKYERMIESLEEARRYIIQSLTHFSRSVYMPLLYERLTERK